METPRESYQMANKCEQQAALVKNPEAREILLEVARKWRKLADEMAREASISRPSSHPSSPPSQPACVSLHGRQSSGSGLRGVVSPIRLPAVPVDHLDAARVGFSLAAPTWWKDDNVITV